MYLEDASVVEHRDVPGGYRLLVLCAPRIASAVRPGQFVHLRIPHFQHALLRRPFSVFRADGDRLALLYKAVGEGTRALRDARAGEPVSLIGPLGRGFPAPAPGRFPLLVAGGYGMAALYLLARALPVRGLAFVGGRGAEDILCVEEFEQLGWTVAVATEDGTRGRRGLVTGPLDEWLATRAADCLPEAYACGPHAMLRAVAERARAGNWPAWLSMDRHMGCGVGACLTCVQKITAADGTWEWARVCREGPVFESRQVVWEAEP